MKKLIKTLFILSGITSISSSVVACNNIELDRNLTMIKNGTTQYEIKELIKEIEKKKEITDFSLNDEEIVSLVKTIAQKELEKNNVEKQITWYDENLQVKERCYNFTVNNGEKNNKKETNWKVRQDTQRFTINISYKVGFINENKKFVDQQKIDMKYDIKVGISESEQKVKKFVTDFDRKIETIKVSFKSDKILKEGTKWSQIPLDKQTKINETIAKELTDQKISEYGTVSWSIKKESDPQVAGNQIKTALVVKSTDFELSTKEFNIAFN